MAQAIKSFFKFLIPRKVDAPIVCIGLLLILASIFPDFIKSAIYHNYAREPDWQKVAAIFAPLSFLLIPLGASFGLFKIGDLKSNSWVVWLTLLALTFLSINSYRNGIVFFGSPTADAEYISSQYPQVFFANIGGFFAAWLATALFIRTIEKSKQRFEQTSFGRTGLMIVVAILLFLILTAFNVMKEFGVGTNSGGGRLIKSGWGSVLAMGLICMFGCAAPAGLINQFRSWRAVPVMVLYFLFAIAVLAVTVSAEETIVLILGYGICFSTILIAMKSFRNSVTQDQVRHRWSIWGWSILALAVALVPLCWHYNVLVLGLTTSTHRFSSARTVKQLSISNGAHAILEAELFMRRGRQPVISGSVYFNDGVSPEYFAPLQELSGKAFVFQLHLSGINPSVKTSYLKQFPKGYGSIKNSIVTISQLDDLSNQSSNFWIVDCEIVEPEGGEIQSGAFSTCTQLYLSQSKPGNTARLLRGIDKQKFTSAIRFHGSEIEFSADDMSEIIEQSRFTPIALYQRLGPDAVENLLADKENSMANRDLFVGGYDNSMDEFWQIMLETRINANSASAKGGKFEPQTYWDAAFVTRCNSWAEMGYKNASEEARISKRNFAQIAQQFHWAFGNAETANESESNSPANSSSDSVKGLIVPLDVTNFVQEISNFTELETLSLDTRWIPSFATNFNSDIPSPVDLSELSKLTDLKRLDLPRDFWALDLLFLKDMPELEQLQIDVFVNATVTNYNFQFRAVKCPNLKTLTLIGLPSNRMLNEIVQLPKLRSLTIVDPNSTFETAGAREQVERVLSPLGEQFILKIVSLDEHQPDVPNAFTKHLEKVRLKVREKYLGADDEVAVPATKSRN